MKIFVDFDDSLFNTKKFRGQLIRIFLGSGVVRKDFLNTYYDYPKKTAKGLKKYIPEKQIEILEKKTNIDGGKLRKDFKKFIQDTKGFVFPDVSGFLKNIKKNNLYLITYGSTNFQIKKIKNSGLFSKFCKIIITDSDKKAVIKRFVEKKETFIFIDDRIENINLVKKHFPNSFTFLLKRKEGRYNDKKTKSVDFKIKNLKEAKKIIKNKIENEKRK